jgi:hypothetical protein
MDKKLYQMQFNYGKMYSEYSIKLRSVENEKEKKFNVSTCRCFYNFN